MKGARTPTALKALAGTDRPCRVRDDEPKPDADNVVSPIELSKDGQKFFDDLRSQLLACKVVTNIDHHALAMLAEELAQMYKMQALIKKHGIISEGAMGIPVISPHFRAHNQLFQNCRKMLAEFGMTPASRTKVGTFEKDKKEDFDF